jgi:hypothetical protein
LHRSSLKFSAKFVQCFSIFLFLMFWFLNSLFREPNSTEEKLMVKQMFAIFMLKKKEWSSNMYWDLQKCFQICEMLNWCSWNFRNRKDY